MLAELFSREAIKFDELTVVSLFIVFMDTFLIKGLQTGQIIDLVVLAANVADTEIGHHFVLVNGLNKEFSFLVVLHLWFDANGFVHLCDLGLNQIRQVNILLISCERFPLLKSAALFLNVNFRALTLIKLVTVSLNTIKRWFLFQN